MYIAYNKPVSKHNKLCNHARQFSFQILGVKEAEGLISTLTEEVNKSPASMILIAVSTCASANALRYVYKMQVKEILRKSVLLEEDFSSLYCDDKSVCFEIR